MRHLSKSSRKVDVVCENQGLCVFLNRIHFVYSFWKCIAFLSLWELGQKEKGKKESDTYISITDFIGLSTKTDVNKWYLMQ